MGVSFYINDPSSEQQHLDLQATNPQRERERERENVCVYIYKDTRRIFSNNLMYATIKNIIYEVKERNILYIIINRTFQQ